MHVDLSGLRALVTGSTKGIGSAIAQKLASCGAEVAINGRKYEDVTRTIDHVRKHVSSAKLIAAGRRRYRPGHCGDHPGGRRCRHPRQQCRRFRNKGRVRHPRRGLEAHVRSQRARLTRHYGPRMRDKGFGRIVFISSSPACRFRPR